MNRLFSCLIAMAIGCAAVGVTHAQEPSPTATVGGSPTPVANLCLGTPRPGGDAIQAHSTMIVTPPGGGTFVIGAAPPGFGGFSICYVEGNARMFIASGCREVSRDNPTNSETAEHVLDFVIESCMVVQPPTPTERPEVSATATPRPSTPITPPDTGTAGLR